MFLLVRPSCDGSNTDLTAEVSRAGGEAANIVALRPPPKIKMASLAASPRKGARSVRGNSHCQRDRRTRSGGNAGSHSYLSRSPRVNATSRLRPSTDPAESGLCAQNPAPRVQNPRSCPRLEVLPSHHLTYAHTHTLTVSPSPSGHCPRVFRLHRLGIKGRLAGGDPGGVPEACEVACAFRKTLVNQRSCRLPEGVLAAVRRIVREARMGDPVRVQHPGNVARALYEPAERRRNRVIKIANR